MLNGIAKADLRIADEPWKADAIGPRLLIGSLLGHGLHLIIA
jgi:hypothetical protein